MNVLVDTSVWSFALRKARHSKDELFVIKKLEELILEYRVQIIGPIRQELLSGIASNSSFLILKKKLEAFKDLEIEPADYERAAEMFNVCRSKGILGSHTDFLICAVAERDHLSIYTLDNDFRQYAKYLPILLYQPD